MMGNHHAHRQILGDVAFHTRTPSVSPGQIRLGCRSNGNLDQMGAARPPGSPKRVYAKELSRKAVDAVLLHQRGGGRLRQAIPRDFIRLRRRLIWRVR
jgi:hypothetical protein